jgi:transcriptional regulator with XRE-family HTH domain
MKEQKAKTNTKKLLSRLFATHSFENFFAKNKEHFNAPTLSQYLTQLCERRGVTANKLIKQVDIDRVFGHQIFSGRRIPSREYILKIAVGLEVSVDECQRLLTISGNSQLYARIPRDAAIIYCLHNKLDFAKTQEKLFESDMTVLGDVKYDKRNK